MEANFGASFINDKLHHDSKRKHAAIRKRKRILIMNLVLLHHKKQKSEGGAWVRKISEDCTKKGKFHLLVRVLRLHHHQYFFRCFHMSPSMFEELLSFIAPIVIKEQ